MTEKKRFEEPQLVKYKEKLDDVTMNNLGSNGANPSFKSFKKKGKRHRK